ncbi:MAG: Dabb family protein [Clostridiales bacterium]|nr:Dabb family protein [Clostridiales bacterium]
MVKHIILWKLRDDIPPEKIPAVKDEIKAGLESLIDKIPGILSITVHTNPLPQSNADLMLDSTFESEEALAIYQSHPEHIKVATFVRANVSSRTCMDFIA